MRGVINRRRFLQGGMAAVSSIMLGNGAAPNGSASPAGSGRLWAKGASSSAVESGKSWFDDTYFNLVVDYYTEVPERPYGSGISRENQIPALSLVRPGMILYYGKGHSGTTAFKSRLGTEHPRLAGDPLAVLRDVTREVEVRLCIYYSGLVDGKAGIMHPEWQAQNKEGKAYGGGPPFYMVPMCPASRYFEDWVTIHLEEIMTRYDPDAIWVDGDWAGGGYCYCARCGRLATERFGDGGIERAEYHVWIRNEYRRKFSSFIRRFKPSCLYSAGNTTPAVDTGLPNYMDWQSGDWFRPDYHRIMQSMAMRRYTTLGLPYDGITCDTQFVHSFHETRSRVKSVDAMLQEGAGILSNGGKWWYWTYPMPNGALIPSRMRQAKACHDFADERKGLWLGTRSVRWTASVDTGARPIWFWGDSASLFGATKTLIYSHRSPDIIHINQLSDPIPYELLVLANQAGVKSEHVKLLEKFVREGGLLLTTGVTARSPEIADLLGIRIAKTDALNEGHVLLQDKTPAGIFTSWDKVELAGAEVWWELYKSWDQDNPSLKWMTPNYPIDGMLDEESPEKAGMPAVTARRLGQGLAVHIAGDPFAEYWKSGPPTTWYFLCELLERMQPQPWFQCAAPTSVEVALRTRGSELFIQFVNVNPGRDMSKTAATDLHVDDIPTSGPFKAVVRCQRKPESVFLEPGGQALPNEFNQGKLGFAVPPLKIHYCVRIRPWPLG